MSGGVVLRAYGFRPTQSQLRMKPIKRLPASAKSKAAGVSSSSRDIEER